MRVSGLSAALGSWPLADDTFALLEVTTDTSRPRWSLIDFISQMEGGRGRGVQTSPAALCVTSTCLEEVALLSQVDDDNNNINNTLG